MPSNPNTLFQFRDKELARIYDANYLAPNRNIAAKLNVKYWELTSRYVLSELSLLLTPEEAKLLYKTAVKCLIPIGSLADLDSVIKSRIETIKTKITETNPELAVKLASIPHIYWYVIFDACYSRSRSDSNDLRI